MFYLNKYRFKSKSNNFTQARLKLCASDIQLRRNISGGSYLILVGFFSPSKGYILHYIFTLFYIAQTSMWIYSVAFNSIIRLKS